MMAIPVFLMQGPTALANQALVAAFIGRSRGDHWRLVLLGDRRRRKRPASPMSALLSQVNKLPNSSNARSCRTLMCGKKPKAFPVICTSRPVRPGSSASPSARSCRGWHALENGSWRSSGRRSRERESNRDLSRSWTCAGRVHRQRARASRCRESAGPSGALRRVPRAPRESRSAAPARWRCIHRNRQDRARERQPDDRAARPHRPPRAPGARACTRRRGSDAACSSTTAPAS